MHLHILEIGGVFITIKKGLGFTITMNIVKYIYFAIVNI
ncbi:MAG: hypothetical protein KQ78_01160 [Candidatus Izimaplasma bacterium HR2]|nr:MAG: hypothetical protein KQ78_01160 [Candidatus Izimaplasma bacterium HR2]